MRRLQPPLLVTCLMLMKRKRLIGILLLIGGLGAQATGRFRPLKTAATEARNETAAPSLSQQIIDAQCIAYFIGDALLLSTAQRHTVARHTTVERRALVMAFTDADFALAQAQYISALHKVLALSQMNVYVALCQRLAGITLPLDGTELVVH